MRVIHVNNTLHSQLSEHFEPVHIGIRRPKGLNTSDIQEMKCYIQFKLTDQTKQYLEEQKIKSRRRNRCT